MADPLLLVAGGAVVKTFELVKALEPLIDKFRAVSKVEATSLAAALDEVHKQLQAVFELTESYRKLALVRDFEQVAPAVLATLEGPKARVRVEHNGGSCVVISNIYDAHLNSWFKNSIGKVFRPEEYAQATSIFQILSDADSGLFDHMAQVCDFLSREAREVLDHITKGEWLAARERVQTGKDALAAVDAQLAETMVVLLKVRNAAISRAGLTSLRPAPAAQS
jgi:hypothetical protein